MPRQRSGEHLWIFKSRHMKTGFVKFALALLFVFAGMNAAHAQIARYKLAVEPFTAIKASNDFKVKMSKSNDYTVEVTVNEVLKEFVQVAVTEGVLHVYFEDKKVTAEIMKPFRGRNSPAPIFDVVVTCPAVIRDVSLEDNASLLDFANVADPEEIRLSVVENAKITSADIESKSASVSTARRGACELKVKAENFKLDAKGSSSISIEQDVKDSEINIGTNISLQLKGKAETMNFNSSGTCKAILNGEADYARFNIVGSSNINALNMKSKEANVEMNSICMLSVTASDWIFINISNGASLTFAGEPQIHINNVRNASVLRYKESE